MGFNPADFRTETGQGEATADQVRLYLQTEEDHVLDNILHAFQIPLDKEGAKKRGAISSRFKAATDSVIAHIEASLKGEKKRLTRQELDIVVAHVRAALRHYEEILEGCAAQLFNELEKMRVDEVGDDTIQGVEAVKEKLAGQVDDCMEQVRRLESKLTYYRSKVKGEFVLLGWVRSFFRPVIDRGVTQKLMKIHKTVNQGYHQLKIRHDEYQRLDEWATKKRAKLDRNPVFQSLPADSREKFANLYRLLKMLKQSESSSEFIIDELNRLLEATIRVNEAVTIFEGYAEALKKAFFVLRRGIPQELDTASDLKATKLKVADAIQAHRKEVRILGSIVFRYRDFILNTHPDPYVRARLGFAESTVGPEPATTKKLVRLGHRVEVLDKQCNTLANVAEAYDPQNPDRLDLGYFDNVVEDLDEMLLEAKRPADAHGHYLEVIKGLEHANELGSFDPCRVMGVEKVMRLALRLDHFNVLVTEKRFLALYETHVNLRGPTPDPKLREALEALEGADDDAWLANAEKALKNLEAFLKKMRGKAPLPFEVVVGEMRQRRFAVLELFYHYRKLLQRLKDGPVPAVIQAFNSRINAIEGEFSTLVSHMSRPSGPMSLDELRILENM